MEKSTPVAAPESADAVSGPIAPKINIIVHIQNREINFFPFCMVIPKLLIIMAVYGNG
jgi:hypothetical protein